MNNNTFILKIINVNVNMLNHIILVRKYHNTRLLLIF